MFEHATRLGRTPGEAAAELCASATQEQAAAAVSDMDIFSQRLNAIVHVRSLPATRIPGTDAHAGAAPTASRVSRVLCF